MEPWKDRDLFQGERGLLNYGEPEPLLVRYYADADVDCMREGRQVEIVQLWRFKFEYELAL